mgnify:FL=1
MFNMPSKAEAQGVVARLLIEVRDLPFQEFVAMSGSFTTRATYTRGSWKVEGAFASCHLQRVKDLGLGHAQRKTEVNRTNYSHSTLPTDTDTLPVTCTSL